MTAESKINDCPRSFLSRLSDFSSTFRRRAAACDRCATLAILVCRNRSGPAPPRLRYSCKYGNNSICGIERCIATMDLQFAPSCIPTPTEEDVRTCIVKTALDSLHHVSSSAQVQYIRAIQNHLRVNGFTIRSRSSSPTDAEDHSTGEHWDRRHSHGRHYSLTEAGTSD